MNDAQIIEIAQRLYRTYWNQVLPLGDNRAWENTSPETRDTWIAVARCALEYQAPKTFHEWVKAFPRRTSVINKVIDATNRQGGSVLLAADTRCVEQLRVSPGEAH